MQEVFRFDILVQDHKVDTFCTFFNGIQGFLQEIQQNRLTFSYAHGNIELVWGFPGDFQAGEPLTSDDMAYGGQTADKGKGVSVDDGNKTFLDIPGGHQRQSGVVDGYQIMFGFEIK